MLTLSNRSRAVPVLQPMASHPAATGRLFALEIDYTNSAHRTMGEGAPNAKAIARLFTELGYDSAPTDGLVAAEPRDIVDAIEEWATSTDPPPPRRDRGQLVLYLAGHGEQHRRYFVMAAPSPTGRWNSRNAISIDDVADHLVDAPARSCVVLLDACHAGQGANQIAAMLRLESEGTGSAGTDVGVLGSSLPLKPSYEGLFVRELTDAMENGSKNEHWRPGSPDITLLELRNELQDRLPDDQLAFTAGSDGLKLPNPAFRPNESDTPVLFEAVLAELSETDREHFLAKAAGSDLRDLGWYFSGRRSATQRLLDWLDEHEAGVYVVTGPPGAGKSAFLGRLAITADRQSQSACRSLRMFDDPEEPRPPVGLFDAVVHARRLDAARVAIAIGEQLGIDVAEASRPEVALRAGLVEEGREVTVMVDAIDEAEPGQHDTVTMGIIRAIGSLPGCRVVVGSRRDVSGTFRGSDDDHGPLLEAMRPASAPWRVDDLGDDPETDADIRAYVEARLAKMDERWPTQERRDEVARVVADQAEGLFLYARFALKVLETKTEQLLDEEGWADALPSDAGEAGLHQVFAEDLARYGDEADRIREVLRPLAFARGRGLPQRTIWPELASELAATGLGGSDRTYVERDVSYVIREAAWYLLEATVGGEVVFRLYHQAIADALREELINAD